jgi:hypothetical protein
MVDFKDNYVEENDEVIFIYDKYNTNKLVEGVVIKTNIMQAGRVMALVRWTNEQGIEVESRVSEPKIYKKSLQDL